MVVRKRKGGLATTNVIRYGLMKRLKLKDFRLSQSYLFWDTHLADRISLVAVIAAHKQDLLLHRWCTVAAASQRCLAHVPSLRIPSFWPSRRCSKPSLPFSPALFSPALRCWLPAQHKHKTNT
ncbi:hypothetical protein D9619_000535 [Psilocybe cf. subviscida]|uniref:Uncharacterized protein n=1 Tax=Psilocybe cf. subviscida TaxID=2480587 RepID=A0A8H5BCW3_9AGAR|nr:hypothetical protein D9619_000535 [Psilocybe cf. subviscida]